MRLISQAFFIAFLTSLLPILLPNLHALENQNKISESSPKASKKLTSNTAYNGTFFLYQSSDKLPLTYDEKPLHYFSHPNPKKIKEKGKDIFIAFVPIGYYEKGSKALKDDFNATKLTITILQKDYPKKEQISVANDKINYSNEVAKRIEREKNDAIKIYSSITEGRLWDKPFIKPLDSVITSPYGSARVFNGKVNSYHGGTDLRAKIGTDIKAINDGRVALVQDRYLSGKSIYIDHGSGLYSVYFHLDSFNVKEGDRVKRGQIIAKSGDSGRVSGAHLHFGIVINGVNIDALDFIKRVNSQLF